MNILRLSALAAAFTFCATTSAVHAQALPAKPKPASAPAAKQPVRQQPDLEQGIEQMFAALDKDKNRQVSFEEFKNGVVAERRQMLIIEQLRNKFKAADKNASGGLDATEFGQLPGLQSLPAPKPAFADYDLNKDKKMDFREYVGFVSKMSAPPAKK
jgi:Ca2+-binding EF-hand superfamily protein